MAAGTTRAGPLRMIKEKRGTITVKIVKHMATVVTGYSPPAVDAEFNVFYPQAKTTIVRIIEADEGQKVIHTPSL